MANMPAIYFFHETRFPNPLTFIFQSFPRAYWVFLDTCRIYSVLVLTHRCLDRRIRIRRLDIVIMLDLAEERFYIPRSGDGGWRLDTKEEFPASTATGKTDVAKKPTRDVDEGNGRRPTDGDRPSSMRGPYSRRSGYVFVVSPDKLTLLGCRQPAATWGT